MKMLFSVLKVKLCLQFVFFFGIGIPLVYAALPTTTGWYAIPNTSLRTICPPNNYGGTGYMFMDNCPAVTTAWNGGAMDTKRNRLIVWGGGHKDYFGNEVYALNLNDSSIQRLTDPGSPIAALDACVPAIAGGTQPNSRHTYDGITYMPNVDKLFVFGGASAGAGCDLRDTWTFDLATLRWQLMNPTGTLPQQGAGTVTAYDPNTGKVFVHDTYNLYAYDFAANSYQQLAAGNYIDYHLTGVIDPVRK